MPLSPAKELELLRLLREDRLERARAAGPTNLGDGVIQYVLGNQIIRLRTGLKRSHDDPHPDDAPLTSAGSVVLPGPAPEPPRQPGISGLLPQQPDRQSHAPQPSPRPQPPQPSARELEAAAAEQVRRNNEAAIEQAERLHRYMPPALNPAAQATMSACRQPRGRRPPPTITKPRTA